MTWEGWTIWDLATGCLPDGRTALFGAGQNGVIYQWDIADGAMVWSSQETEHPGSMMAVEMVPSGGGAAVIVSGDDAGRIWRWDAMTGEQLGDAVAAHTSPVRILEASASWEKAVFFSTDQDGLICGWNALTGVAVGPTINTGAQVFSLATATVGDTEVLFAAGVDATVRAWQASTGDPIDLSLSGSVVSTLSRPEGTVLLATSTATDGVTVHECAFPISARPPVPG
ncbi:MULTISPECIES: WD40 repeat domain-containing protein [unclassified Streptomyces]|uniref:WD40 repeat domain-containing protein n=1 Tax=unclassified Streptomyces TaxID=2593676 RepID=UPI00131CF590|nr:MULTISPECIES: WD40 repeat domain-containing protein [unclassified Streptomyces]